jgi:phage shock protein C
MSARRTKFLGVCAGIADYIGVDATWVRVATVLGIFLGLPFLILGYFAIAWIADSKPYALYDDDDDTRKFWQRTRVAPQRSIRDVRSSFRDVDRRLRDIETHVTSSNRTLAAEIDSLR